MNNDCYSPRFRPLEPADVILDAGVDWKNGLLVRSTNWLGDALMTLPAVWQLRRNLPAGKKLTVLSPGNLEPVWRACPFVDDVIRMGGKRISAEEIAAVKAQDLGVAMVLPNSFGSAMDVWKTGIPVRLGRRGRWRRAMLTQSIREWKCSSGTADCHQLCYYLELASMLGNVDCSADYPPLAVSADMTRTLGMTADARWLAIAPGAAYGPAKQWPVEYFAAVGKWHCSRGGRVVIVGGGKEAAVASTLAGMLPPGTLNLAGKTDLWNLMAVLAASDAIVANDSGAMHLGAALGKSGVALFGSTDPVATGPLGGHWRLMIADVPCRPCFKRVCMLHGDDGYKCLKSLGSAAVIEALAVFLP